MFLGKGVLKICCKFTGEHPCRSAISIKLQCCKFTGENPCRSVISMKLQSNFIEITLRHGSSPVNLQHILRTPFPKNTSGHLLLELLKPKSKIEYHSKFCTTRISVFFIRYFKFSPISKTGLKLARIKF